MTFNFFTVVAAVFALYHSTEATAIPSRQSEAAATAIWNATAPYPGLLHMFRALNIAMTPQQLSSYVARLQPEIPQLIVTYLNRHYSQEIDNMLYNQRFVSRGGDVKSVVLLNLARHILQQEDMKALFAEKGLDTTNAENLVASLKSSLAGLLN